MGLGIRPTVDFAFKLMLGSPQHTNITIHFLNAILEGQARITQVQILNPILDKDTDDDKLAVLDVLATDEHGRMLNIEVQTSLPAELPQRLAYYAASLYVDQLDEGSAYSELRPAITICVLTHALFRQSLDLHLEFRLREQSGLQLTDNLQIHLLQLPMLRVSAQNVYHASPVERWAYFLANGDKLSDADIVGLFPDPEIAEAAGVLKMIDRTPDAQLRYRARLKFQRDQESLLRGARMDGLKEGVDQGLEQGLAIGRIQVLQQLLGQSVSPMELLKESSLQSLSELEADLQQQINTRNSK